MLLSLGMNGGLEPMASHHYSSLKLATPIIAPVELHNIAHRAIAHSGSHIISTFEGLWILAKDAETIALLPFMLFDGY